MRKFPLLFILFLCSCAQMRQEEIEKAHNDAGAIVAYCEHQKAIGVFKKYVEIYDCANGPATAVYQKINYPHMDITQWLAGKYLETYTLMDAKKLSPAQGKLAISEATMQANNLILQRNTMESNALAARQAASAASLSAFSNLQAAQQMNAPRRTNCYNVGNMMHCNSY